MAECSRRFPQLADHGSLKRMRDSCASMTRHSGYRGGTPAAARFTRTSTPMSMTIKEVI
jgi:hypothetical protein